MSNCPMLTYSNISGAVWSRIVAKAGSYGVSVSTPSGSKTADGFTISWNYEQATGTLQLQCTAHPFWAGCSAVQSKIHDIVEACMNPSAVATATGG